MVLKNVLDWLTAEGYCYSFVGDENYDLIGFSSLSNLTSGKLVWIKNKSNYDKLPSERIVSCAVVQAGLELAVPNQIITDNSKEVYFSILRHFWGTTRKEGFVGQGTVIADGAIIDPTAYIGYNCSIIGPVYIGAHTIIENNVVISGRVTIGDYCHIQSEAVIGIDGFSYTKNQDTGAKTMVEHFGGVKIGNNVFIASHVNIARGTLDDTVISDGVKIAPSTHIGHNNIIGENATIICANLFGSVKTGKDAYIVASTVQNQMEVGEHTVIGMGSVVTRLIPSNVVAFGCPAVIVKENTTDL